MVKRLFLEKFALMLNTLHVRIVERRDGLVVARVAKLLAMRVKRVLLAVGVMLKGSVAPLKTLIYGAMDIE